MKNCNYLIINYFKRLNRGVGGEKPIILHTLSIP